MSDGIEATQSAAPFVFYGDGLAGLRAHPRHPALVARHRRGLGVVGFVPAWMCDRWAGELEAGARDRRLS